MDTLVQIPADVQTYNELDGKVNAHIVFPGEEIPTEPGYLQGKNTIVVDGKLKATVCGFVQQVNKLIMVVPIKGRYNPQVGDLIVGRIDDIAQQKWNVDIGAGQRSSLQLTAIQLPDAVQRRRTQQDALEMRKYFVEGDLLSAEVQKVDLTSDSSSLHTRSTRYGRMENGVVVCVPPSLVRRQANHLAVLDCGVQVLLGANGRVFVGAAPKESAMDTLNYTKHDASAYRMVSAELREKVARVRNIVAALAANHRDVTVSSIEVLMEISLTRNLTAKDLLKPSVAKRLVEQLIAGEMGDGTEDWSMDEDEDGADDEAME